MDGSSFDAPQLVPGVNSACEDGQPNLRRDALELFFYSTRRGTLGLADIFVATRANAHDSWGTPSDLGPSVNTAAGAETRPFLSWDGTTLYFGSTVPANVRPSAEGSSDIYYDHHGEAYWRAGLSRAPQPPFGPGASPPA